MLQCICSALFSSLFLCFAMAYSFVLLPDMSPSLFHLGLGVMSPSLLAAPFLYTRPSGMWGPPRVPG